MSFTFYDSLPFIELQQVESTNNYAIGLVHAGMAQHGMAVFAHHQTAGKGQRNKTWQGEAGKNIALTMVLLPSGLALSQSFLLSKAIAVGVYRFISKYAGEETKIKWPNDIYWRDRKTAGILIENIVQGNSWKYCIAGVGININQTTFIDITNKVVSLKQITGKEFDPLLLAKELRQFLIAAFDELIKDQSILINFYKENLYRLHQTVSFKNGARLFKATVKDVMDDGRLVVEGTLEETFQVGEIEWLT